MVKAIFLDRDGVINRAFVREGKPYPPRCLEEFVILDGVHDSCRILKACGYCLVVATNQPDVGRGILTREMVEEMHAKMCRELPIDRVEVCYDPGEASRPIVGNQRRECFFEQLSNWESICGEAIW